VFTPPVGTLSLTTQQNFATVTEVTMPGGNNIFVGTAPTATSRLVMFDPWAAGNISKQVNVSGVVNYSIQISNDDPNSPTARVRPGAMTWFDDPDANFVGASTPMFGDWQFAPLFARLVLNSGTGSASATFLQTENVNR
jgi:hypothetical protein